MDLRQPSMPNFDELNPCELGASHAPEPVCPQNSTEQPARAERASILPRASLVPRPARRRPSSGKRSRGQGAAAHQATPAAKRAPRATQPSELQVAELLTCYTPLVRQIVGGFQRKLPRNVLRDDLIAAGMSGLWDAIRRQGDSPDASFEWYVRVRIRGAILDELRAQDWLPRRVRAAVNEAEESGVRNSPNPAVVRMEDVSEWEQRRCLATTDTANGEAALDAKLTKTSLSRAVDQLPERERHIVSMHYFNGVKFKDLGAELGVSEPRVSQLHSRAMKRLRSIMADPAADAA